jgi:hypothetical protein
LSSEAKQYALKLWLASCIRPFCTAGNKLLVNPLFMTKYKTYACKPAPKHLRYQTHVSLRLSYVAIPGRGVTIFLRPELRSGNTKFTLFYNVMLRVRILTRGYAVMKNVLLYLFVPGRNFRNSLLAFLPNIEGHSMDQVNTSIK